MAEIQTKASVFKTTHDLRCKRLYGKYCSRCEVYEIGNKMFLYSPRVSSCRFRSRFYSVEAFAKAPLTLQNLKKRQEDN